MSIWLIEIVFLNWHLLHLWFDLPYFAIWFFLRQMKHLSFFVNSCFRCEMSVTLLHLFEEWFSLQNAHVIIFSSSVRIYLKCFWCKKTILLSIPVSTNETAKHVPRTINSCLKTSNKFSKFQTLFLNEWEIITLSFWGILSKFYSYHTNLLTQLRVSWNELLVKWLKLSCMMKLKFWVIETVF